MSCVGHYEFAPNALLPTGMKVTIRREEDQVGLASLGRELTQGPFEIYPESETNFFDRITGAQMTFNRNNKGEMTAVIHHAGFPDCVGKKLPDPTK